MSGPGVGEVPLSTELTKCLVNAANLGEGINLRDLSIPPPLDSQEKMMVNWKGDCPTALSAEVTIEIKPGAFPTNTFLSR